MTRTCGESEGVVKVLAEFSEATYMVSGSISGVYQALLSGQALSSMEMGGILKAGIPQLYRNVLLKHL